MTPSFEALTTMFFCLSASVSAFAEETTAPIDTSTTIQSTVDSSIITPASSTTGYINADGVRLRESASLSGTILGLLYNGTQVEIADSLPIYADGIYWQYVYVISTRQGGYVAKQYITEYPPE